MRFLLLRSNSAPYSAIHRGVAHRRLMSMCFACICHLLCVKLNFLKPIYNREIVLGLSLLIDLFEVALHLVSRCVILSPYLKFPNPISCLFFLQGPIFPKNAILCICTLFRAILGIITGLFKISSTSSSFTYNIWKLISSHGLVLDKICADSYVLTSQLVSFLFIKVSKVQIRTTILSRVKIVIVMCGHLIQFTELLSLERCLAVKIISVGWLGW